MSDGWGRVAAGMRREGEDPTSEGPTDAGDERAAPPGWEGLRARRRSEPTVEEETTPDEESDAAGDEAHVDPDTDTIAAASDEDEPGDGADLDEEDAVETDAPNEGDLQDDVDADGEDGGQSLGERLAGTWAAARRRPRALIAAAAVVAAAVIAGVLVLVLPGGGLPADAAFSVNGKVTTVAEFKTQTAVLNELNNVTVPKQSDVKDYSAYLRTSAHALAVQDLVADAARKEGISVPQKTTRDALDQLVTQDYGGSESSLDSALASAGLNETQVLDALNAQEVENNLFDKHTSAKVTVTDAQITQVFNANQSSFTEPEQRAVSIIVVGDQATADGIVAQLQAGGNFAALAQQDSDDSSKAQGGSIGTYTESGLQASGLASAVFGATPNAPFGPVEVPGSNGQQAWVVGEVTNVIAPTEYGNDSQTQAAIRNYLTDQAQRTQWIAYLTGLIKRAHIRYAPTYRPADPDAPPQQNLPSVASFVINAHTQTSSSGSSSSGSAGSTGASGTGTTGGS